MQLSKSMAPNKRKRAEKESIVSTGTKPSTRKQRSRLLAQGSSVNESFEPRLTRGRAKFLGKEPHTAEEEPEKFFKNQRARRHRVVVQEQLDRMDPSRHAPTRVSEVLSLCLVFLRQFCSSL